MAAVVDNTLSWAERHISFFQGVLNDAEGDHETPVLASPDGLLSAHVIGICSLLSKKPGAPWPAHFASCDVKNQAVALHLWLYHLVGGSAAGLAQPSKETSKTLHARLIREATSFRVSRNELV